LAVLYSGNFLVFVLGRAIGIIFVPALSGAGWLYVWRESEDPVRFLGYWCSAVQLVNLVTNLIRIQSSAWGITGVATIAATATLIVIYVKGYFRSWLGNLATVTLIIVNTGITSFLFLNSLDNLTSLGLWMIDETASEGFSLLGSILTDISILNVLASMAPQVFLLDLESKIREYQFTEAAIGSLDSEADLSRVRPKRPKQQPEAPVEPFAVSPEVVTQKLEAPVRAVPVSRYQFIDFTRGVVMIIMAWDHLAGFWGKYKGGKMLIGKAPFPEVFAWFMSRFITHYCAPTFIFIAGAVLAVSAARRLGGGASQRDVSLRMIKRGSLLIFLQFFVVNGAWEKQYNLYSFLFGILACIGACFILFSFLRLLPPKIVLALSLFTILNHQFLNLDWIPEYTWWGHYLRVIVHEPNEYYWYPFTGRYPIIPWIGVMGLGWVFGMYLKDLDPARLGGLKRPLVVVGLAAKALWVVVRWFNGYGNLRPRMDNSLWEWLWLAKYPPSLGFLLWSLGGMCLIMALGLWLEERLRSDRGLTGFTSTLGRNALFFYVVHLWLYRFRLPGVPQPDFKLDFIPAVLAWLAGLPILWQLCIRYERLKKRHPNSILQYI